jgi:hypothetical protein
MSTPFGTLIARTAVAACLTLGLAPRAFAQHPVDAPPAATEFMPRFDWKMSAARLGNADPRFTWDTHWAGDFDLFSVPKGRATFLADYQALLGSEFRPFDPYQSNYLLEASGSVFRGPLEIAGVLSHISRHLGDRPKRLAVAENSLGPRVMRRFGQGAGESLDVRVDIRKVIARAYDDYSWIGDVDLVGRAPLSPHTQMYVRGYGEMFWIDKTIAGRDAQRGGRIEAGVKLLGTGGAMELFGGAERMVDADPLDRKPQRWAFVGFRLLGR